MIRALALALASLTLALSAAAQDSSVDVLMSGAYNGSISDVRSSLKRGAPIDSIDENGETALMYAVDAGHDDIARLLVDKGAAVDALSTSGETALFYAALKERPAAARLLLAHGAQTEVRNSNGDTPLMIAASHGSLETAKALLEKGAQINAHGGGGSTPLIMTVLYGQTEAARFLIGKGADIEARDNSGATALIKTAPNDRPEIAGLLIEKGADVNARDNNGATALINAAAKGRYEIAQLLIDKGADVNVADTYGERALQFATAAGSADIAAMIHNVLDGQADSRDRRQQELQKHQDQLKAAEAARAASADEQRRKAGSRLFHIALAAGLAAALLVAAWAAHLALRRKRRLKALEAGKGLAAGRIRELSASDPLKGYEALRVYEAQYGDLSAFSGAELLRLYEARDHAKQSSPENLQARAQAQSKAATAGRVRELTDSDPRSAYEALQDYIVQHGDASPFTGAELGRLYELSGREAELLAGALHLTDEQNVGVAAFLSGRGKNDQAIRLVSAEPLLSGTIRFQDGCDEVIRIYDKAGALKDLFGLCAAKTHEFQTTYARAFLALGRTADCLKAMGLVRVKDRDDQAVIAAALAYEGKIDEAVKTVEDIPKASWSFVGWSAFLQFCLKTGRWEEAREAWEHFQPLRPLRRDPKLHYGLGLACEAAGRADLAGMIFHPFVKAGLSYKDAFERASRLPKPPEEAHRRAAPEPEQASGSRIGGRYDLRSELGRGDLGTVYAAFDSRLGAKAALKKIRPEVAGDSKERARFLHQAKLVSRLEHPAIIGVREIIEEGSDIYLVFDFAEGAPLARVLSEKKRLSLAQCKAVLEPVCQALDYAHIRNIVHGTLRPVNIMVGPDGRGKVLDLGLARASRARDAYTAPEGAVSRAGDVYSLGVCLFEMATGQLPSKGVSPHSLVPQLPREMDSLFASVFTPDPNERISDALEFFAELKRF